MDKWSALRQVLEYDLSIAREGSSLWDEHLTSIIKAYLQVMKELDEDDSDGGNTEVA